MRSAGVGWRTAKIEDVTEKVAMGPFGSSIKVDTFVPEGMPVITGKHLHGSRVDDKPGFNFITDEHAERLSNANVVRGDIVMTHRGTIGQVAIVPETSQFDRYVVSQSQFFLRCDRSKVIPEFLTLYFKSPEGQHQLLANSAQVGVPSIAQPVTYVRQIEVPLPSLDEQRAIAHVLGTLDDKIELNRRMNETLEATARALFRSWFVDFEPVRAKMEGRWGPGDSLPGLPAHLHPLFPDRLVPSELGDIPEGWEVRGLDGIADFTNGLALQRFPPEGDEWLPVIKIAEMRRGYTEKTGKASANLDSRHIVEDGDVLFSWSGSLELVLWSHGRGALNQHLFKVTSNEFSRWFYWGWLHQHLDDFRGIAAGKATTMGHIQRHHLTDAKVAVPPTEILRAADGTLGSLLQQQVALAVQSRDFATLRDTLLPRLVSGQLRLKSKE